MTKIARDATAHSRFTGLVMNETSVVQYEGQDSIKCEWMETRGTLLLTAVLPDWWWTIPRWYNMNADTGTT